MSKRVGIPGETLIDLGAGAACQLAGGLVSVLKAPMGLHWTMVDIGWKVEGVRNIESFEMSPKVKVGRDDEIELAEGKPDGDGGIDDLLGVLLRDVPWTLYEEEIGIASPNLFKYLKSQRQRHRRTWRWVEEIELHWPGCEHGDAGE